MTTLLKENDILRFHILILKCLGVWPLNFLSSSKHRVIRIIVAIWAFISCSTVFTGVGYQIYMGIDSPHILLEILVGAGNVTVYYVAYYCFLTRHNEIQNLIRDFRQFVQFSGIEAIESSEKRTSSYAKYMLRGVTGSLLFTYIWELVSIDSCTAKRESEYYVKHDPCGLPVRNWYPFEANGPRTFWIVFAVQFFVGFHVSVFFSSAIVIVIGFLMHITDQLRHCGSKFQHAFDEADSKPRLLIKREFITINKYHGEILRYAERVFQVFNTMIGVYVSLTSTLMAIICYQIVNPNITTQDRMKYVILLSVWCLLIYLICYSVQQVQDESLKVGQAIFESQWYQASLSSQMRPYILFALMRSQKPLVVKTELFGNITLFQFMRVIKLSYTILTVLLSETGED